MNSVDQHSPQFSDHEEDLSDNFEYTLKSSTRRTPNVQSFSSPNQRFQDSNSLIFQDIITDEQTLEFLYKHFSGVHPEALDIESFLDALLQEFFIRNPSLPNTIEDIEFFRKELRDLLRNSLTTNDEEVVSLNALEVNTKKKGLYNFVFDLAMEAEGESKAKKSVQINEAIVNELSIVTQMLDNKKEELRIYEKKLREYEASLIERENQMRQSIQSEYERLVTSFDEGYREKFNGIQKKFATHEKSTKQKIKQYESQIKEMKSFTASLSGNEEKLKYKLSSLERTNDFLKHKAQDLEKKLAQEQESKQSASQKNQKLLSKVSLLEKSMKDLQTMHTQSLATSQNFPKHFGTDLLHDKHDERPLEVIDLNASHTKGWDDREMTEPRGASLSPDFEEKEEENKNSKGLKKKPVTKFATTSSLMKKNTKKEAPVVVETSPVKKKKPAGTTTSGTGPSAEMKVLLNVVHSLIVCLKSTLPVFIQAYEGKEGSPRKEQGPRMSTREENLGEKVFVDLGEIFYPSFDSLITNLTELLPIVGKQYDTKYVSSIVEMYYKLLNFFFKLKVQHKFDHTNTLHRLFSDYDMQGSTNRIKTGQDHVNEIMVLSQSPKENAEINFVPQTEYWKKIMKNAKPLQKSKYGVDLQSSVLNSLAKNSKPSQNKSEGSFINLFGDEIVQKEVASILKKYLDSTEVLLRGSEKEAGVTSSVNSAVIFQTNMSLETQKYLQITRIYSSLSTILLAKTKKEQMMGLQSLLVDLNIDNVKIAEFLRVFLIENDGLNVVFWILQNNIDDFEMLQVATDILLSLNYNGAHYKYFIETISQQENIEVIFSVLTSHGQNNEFCEKMSVIVQRVTYHNSLQGKIPPKQIKFLKEKLNELEASNKNQFFIANIKSILVNLNAI